MKKLVLFDFDGTITTKDSLFEFIKFTNSRFTYYSKLLLCIPIILIYFLKLLDEKSLKEKILSFYFKNRKKNYLFGKGKIFIENMLTNNTIKKEFIKLIKKYQNEGCDIAVVSASLDIWLQPFCEIYDLTCLCTRTDYSSDNYFKGKIVGKNCKGMEKKVRVCDHYNLKNYSHIIVYGDSVGDKEMMELGNERYWI